MESKVMGWGDITGTGIDLSGYAWQTDKVPVGQYEAVLDYKVWSNKITGINCYFRIVETGELIKLTLFRLKDGNYKLEDGDLDFKDCPTGVNYRIKTALNGKGNICFKECSQIPAH